VYQVGNYYIVNHDARSVKHQVTHFYAQ